MKQIPLTQGKFALVDNEDFEELNKHKWCAIKSKDTFYASRSASIKKGDIGKKNIKMHRVILSLNDSEIKCDHIDHNGLNNQRYNLRPSTSAENARNAKPSKNKFSKYKGVCWKKSKNRWEDRIMINRKSIGIGTFKDEIEAAKAYDKKAKELFGEFAYLNFKD